VVKTRPQHLTSSTEPAMISHSLVCGFPDASILDECLSVQPAAAGSDIVGGVRCRSLWLRLLQSPAFNAVAICRPQARHHCVGFGASVFVSCNFAMKERTRPRPGLNARLMAAVDAGEGVVLTAQELARGNAEGTLSLLILYSAWRRDGLCDGELEQIKAMLASTFFEVHLGYGMKEWLSEATDATQISYAHDTAVWSVGPFEDPDSARAFLYVDRDTACRRVGSIAAILFQPRMPIFGLSCRSQELLRQALRGQTDEELAGRLKISTAAVKKRWIRIFEDVERRVPSFASAAPLGDSVRGPQRRHRLLAYIREHPEELRAFASSEAFQGVVRGRRSDAFDRLMNRSQQ